MAAQPHVIVVEDEPAQRHLLTGFLLARGLRAVGVDGGVALRALIGRVTPSLVILDVGLRGEDGIALAQFLRSALPDAGIIMVTAAGDTHERVAGLESGADDYLIKPYEPRELLARVRSVLRRVSTMSGTGAAPAKVRMGRRILDLERRCLLDDSGREESLASADFELLRFLGAHPNHPLTRDALLEHVGQHGTAAYDRAIDVRIARLRRRIEADPAHPDTIRTVRGVGYMFVPSER